MCCAMYLALSYLRVLVIYDAFLPADINFQSEFYINSYSSFLN